MALIDIENLLGPCADEPPAGPNLEYDPEFSALERAVRGTSEQQMGSTIVAGEPPDWAHVRELAATLLLRSKDLRLGVYLAKSLLHLHGFQGLSDGLQLVSEMLIRYWDTVHPQLDPSDDLDPTIRVNALLELCDPTSSLGTLRGLPLVASPTFGRFALRDLQAAPAGGSEKLADPIAVSAAFQSAPLEVLTATSQAIQGARQHLQAIETTLTERLSGGFSADFSKLAQLLFQAKKLVAEPLDRRTHDVQLLLSGGEHGGGNAASDAGGAAPGPGGGARSPEGALDAATRARGGEIATREEVVRAIDKICEYYTRYEPASPLPMLLQRCKRLASMSFLDIIRDMAPDALAHVELITGKAPDAS